MSKYVVVKVHSKYKQRQSVAVFNSKGTTYKSARIAWKVDVLAELDTLKEARACKRAIAALGGLNEHPWSL